MKTEITITLTEDQHEMLKNLIDMTANMGTFRRGDVLQFRDEELLAKIYATGQAVQKESKPI